MASFFDLTKPYIAYYSVPVAFLLGLLPHAYASTAAGKNFDLAYPRRAAEASSRDPSLDKQTALRIQRAEAASANAFETLGMYAGGIAAAAAAGVPAGTLSRLAAGYLASRLAFNVAYVLLQDNRRAAPLRSLSWGVGVLIIVTTWVKAGNRAAAAA